MRQMLPECALTSNAVILFNDHTVNLNFNQGQQRCGFYDPSLPHGGPFDPDERFLDGEFDDYEDFEFDERYDREDPCKGKTEF